MEILTLVKANIKKRKASFIGVFILIFIISVFLTSIITIRMNSNSSITEKVENVCFGDMLSWLYRVDDINKLVLEMGSEGNGHIYLIFFKLFRIFIYSHTISIEYLIGKV